MLFDNRGVMESQHSDELSAEAQSLIMEAAITESVSEEELTAFLESNIEVNAAINDNILLERTIVRLDKKAKLTRAQKMAVFTIAKERNDPQLKKLLTVWRMEKYLEGILLKKYGNEALRRARKAVRNSSNSKSKMMKTVASRVKSQLNNGVSARTKSQLNAAAGSRPQMPVVSGIR